MNNKTTQFMTRTAVMLALTVLFQAARYLFPAPSAEFVTYIISTLVNLCLIVAAATVSVWSGLIIAVLAPIVALFQGHAQAPMLLPIMLGNAIIATGGALGFKSLKRVWITFLAAPIKYAVIALGMVLFMFMGVQKQSFMAALPVAFTKQFVQLPTAILATIIAIPIVGSLKRALHIT